MLFRSKFGRLLGVLYRDEECANNRILSYNESLVVEGHAVRYDGGKR